jgi:MFS family permease
MPGPRPKGHSAVATDQNHSLVRSAIVWRRDFSRLWTAYTISACGSAVGMGALSIIAVLDLHSTTLQVALLAALSGVASAVIALPLGAWIEFRRKRPVMVAADLLRFVALGSVPVAALGGVLTYAQLCVVGVVQTAANIVFTTASGANIKSLVPPEQRTEADARLETTFWIANTSGPPIGGVLISRLGATATIAIDAISFLGSALGIGRMSGIEAAPPIRPAGSCRRPIVSTLRSIRSDRAKCEIIREHQSPT